MGKVEGKPRRRKAISQEARENQLISLAYNAAEQQMLDGTASSQVITHFLKIGSQKYQREIERLEEENKLLRAKTENIESQKQVEELYKEAIKHMKIYSGEASE